jgi:serine/threonine-protein kinase
MNVERWSRVKEVFHAALEQAPADRAVFLNEACVDDQALRAEAERLDAHAQDGTFIEDPALLAIPEPEDLVATMTGRIVDQ